MKTNRKQQILEALARQLETAPGSRITTAVLADAVGVSEAALYRHFPSKAKMFEGLIEFCEESIFTLVNRIVAENEQAEVRCHRIATVVLRFAETNPGLARILCGDALSGEHARLRHQVAQIFARLETQFNQLMQHWAVAQTSQKVRATTAARANLLSVTVSGLVSQYVRSEFRDLPTRHWDAQWPVLADGIFNPSTQ